MSGDSPLVTFARDLATDTKGFVKDMIEKANAPVLYRLAAAEAEIAVLKGKPHVKYHGVHDPAREYGEGDAVTAGGNLWIARTLTRSKPGDDATWTLAVRKGRDAR
jgi:hypothetical protein